MTTKEVPQVTNRGLTFFPVPEFSGPSVAFGADENCYFNRRDLPSVPREFAKMVSDLFFSGGSLPEFDPRVDREKAIRATKAWLSSWAPAHESKEATVAYAFWVWSSKEALDSI